MNIYLFDNGLDEILSNVYDFKVRKVIITK